MKEEEISNQAIKILQFPFQISTSMVFCVKHVPICYIIIHVSSSHHRLKDTIIFRDSVGKSNTRLHKLISVNVTTIIKCL